VSAPPSLAATIRPGPHCADVPAAADSFLPHQASNQLDLFAGASEPAAFLPDLAAYDVLLVNSSGGKDCQTMLDCVHERALEQGVADRITVVHADLGEVEWPDTRELARAQAARYAVRFELVAARDGLLERTERRGMWPDAARRWCTSDLKRGPVRTVMTRLARELDTVHRPRILNLIGLRAEESPARARRAPLAVDDAASSGRREVTQCLPLFHWRLEHVWRRIAASVAADLVHPAYTAGMPRLSRSFCVLAPKAALVRAAQLRPEMAREYLAHERRIGHSFKANLSMADIVAAAQTDDPSDIEALAG
jgi:3'-phosphoadenosine 5'-phosphosulfate sulfotransferase (PAPS reductase)/FAD synthetase